MRNLLKLAQAYLLWRLVFAGVMTDQNRVNSLLGSIMHGAPAWPTIPAAWTLRLMSANGSNTVNGTELTTANGYTVLGNAMTAWAAPAAGVVQGPIAAVSWTATGAGFTTVGIEIWDGAGTPLRWFFGPLSGGSVTVNAGNTLQFAINSIVLTATAW